MKALLDLFLTFAKVGLFTFGGGYAMISIIENSCVEIKKWITHDEMMDITVIAESTPGPIAINCATYIGYKNAGFLGSVSATLGIILPSFVIIYLISILMDNFLEIEIITRAFQGIKIGVGLLILDAGMSMVKKMPKRKIQRIIMISSCIIVLISNVLSLNVSTIVIMIFAGLVSLALFINQQKQGGSL